MIKELLNFTSGLAGGNSRKPLRHEKAFIPFLHVERRKRRENICL
jgi:hypothetical protein